MPYDVVKRGSQYCVEKRGGGTHGCHSTKEKARRQQRALYAAESASADGGESMTVVEEEQQEVEEETREPWSGVLAMIMSPTDDGRIVESDISHRDLPVPFSVQPAKAEGHDGAQVAGRIETIDFIPFADFSLADEFDMDEVRDGAVVVWGTGSLDGSSASDEAKRLLENGAGVSLDGLHFSGRLFSSEDLSEVNPEEMPFDELFAGVMDGSLLRGLTGKIAGVTVVDVPAFEEATVMLASAYMPQLRFGTPNLTASAAGIAPLMPPTEWFFMDEPDQPTALTVDKDGRVYGHLALWNQCHAAFASCETPPRSSSNYQFFHVGQIETEEGELVNVGRITVGKNGNAKGGHASIVLGRKGAMEHYEANGCVAAFVRAKDGNHGIWLSGAVRSDAPAEKVRDLRANPPSGDWRDYELVGVLSVPVPGFPIPRSEMRLVASGGEEEIAAMIASASAPPGGEAIWSPGEDGEEVIVGWTFSPEIELEMDMPTYRKRMAELAERRKAVAGEIEGLWYWEEPQYLKDYSSSDRKKMAESGEAMPDGSFPIRNCQDASNAERAVGRAAPGKRPAVRRHIASRKKALGCK
jgi:hypothetical protein